VITSGLKNTSESKYLINGQHFFGNTSPESLVNSFLRKNQRDSEKFVFDSTNGIFKNFVQFRVAARTTVPSRRQGGKSGQKRSTVPLCVDGGDKGVGYEEGLNGWWISRRSLHGGWFTGRPSSGRCSPSGRQFSIASRQGWTWVPQARTHIRTNAHIHTHARASASLRASTLARFQ